MFVVCLWGFLGCLAGNRIFFLLVNLVTFVAIEVGIYPLGFDISHSKQR